MHSKSVDVYHITRTPQMLKQWITTQLKSPDLFPGRVLLPRIWNRRNRALNEMTLVNLDVAAGDVILEIGIGGGYLLQRIMPLLSDGYLVGIDKAHALTHRAQKIFRRQISSGLIGIKCADTGKLPFPDGTFNKVCSVNSIFYWDDVSESLKEISRVLQVSGLLVLTFTAAECLKDRVCLDQKHLFDPVSVSSLLENAGFHRVRCETHADRHRPYYCCIAVK